MGTNIYVGNLSYSVRDADLSELFSQFGDVKSAKVIMERETNRSKGFAFVEMETEDESQTEVVISMSISRPSISKNAKSSISTKQPFGEVADS